MEIFFSKYRDISQALNKEKIVKQSCEKLFILMQNGEMLNDFNFL